MKAILKFFTEKHGYSFIDLLVVTLMVQLFLDQTLNNGAIIAVVFGAVFIPLSYYLTKKFGK